MGKLVSIVTTEFRRYRKSNGEIFWVEKLFRSNLKIPSLVQICRKSESGDVYGNLVMYERVNYEFHHMSG